MVNKQLLEEIKRFNSILNYNPSLPSTLNEADNANADPFDDGSTNIPMLKGREIKKGRINFENTENAPGLGKPPIAGMKNKGFLPEVNSKFLYLFFNTQASAKNLTIAPYNNMETPPPTPTPTPTTDVMPIAITFDLQDPFRFDKTQLTNAGETSFNNFITDFKTLKQTYANVWDKYLKFLKLESEKNPIYLRGYSSIDGDPKKIIADSATSAKTYAPCRKSGGRPRADYNLCLSQARAEETLERIEKELPELSGIFTAKGMGETTNFANFTYENGDTTKTAPNRRMVLDALPVFKTDMDIPIDDENDGDNGDKNNVTPVVPSVNFYGDKISDYGPYEAGEYYYFYCKYYPKSDYRIQVAKNGVAYLYFKREMVVADGSTNSTWMERKHIASCKAEVEGKNKKPDGYWQIGKDFNLSDDSITIEYYVAANTKNILVSVDDIKDVFGTTDAFRKIVPEFIQGHFQGESTPMVELTSNGANIITQSGSYFYKGWEAASTQETAVDVSSIASTELKRAIVMTEEIGDTTFFEIGLFGLSIAKPTGRFGER